MENDSGIRSGNAGSGNAGSAANDVNPRSGSNAFACSGVSAQPKPKPVSVTVTTTSGTNDGTPTKPISKSNASSGRFCRLWRSSDSPLPSRPSTPHENGSNASAFRAKRATNGTAAASERTSRHEATWICDECAANGTAIQRHANAGLGCDGPPFWTNTSIEFFKEEEEAVGQNTAAKGEGFGAGIAGVYGFVGLREEA